MRRHAQVELWRVTTAQEGEQVGLDRDSKVVRSFTKLCLFFYQKINIIMSQMSSSK
jgi:hypothetical protein